MYADIRLDEVQNKLSAGCHFSEFKRSHERSQGFKQKKYIPPGCGILETHGGGVWRMRTLLLWGM
jgi:hypothetical protein